MAILTLSPGAWAADAVTVPLSSAFEHLLRYPGDETFRKAVTADLHDAGEDLATTILRGGLSRPCQSGPRLLPPVSAIAAAQHREMAVKLATAMLAEAARRRDLVGTRLAWHFFSEACLRGGQRLESLVYWAIATHHAEPEFRQGFVHEVCARAARQQARLARSLERDDVTTRAIADLRRMLAQHGEMSGMAAHRIGELVT